MKQRPSEQLWNDFGAWVRENREQRNLSQADAAKGADIDRQQWYRIETGKSGTRRDTVIQIARALGVDVTEALERAGYASAEDRNRNFEIGENARIALLDKDLSPEDAAEIAQEMEIAYEVAMRRRARSKEQHAS